MQFDLIVAVDSCWGISRDGGLPWSKSSERSDDIKWFKHVTVGNTVIMGRKTWESIPAEYRPLSNRINIIISSKNDKTIVNDFENARVVNVGSFTAALDYCTSNCIVIGGNVVYEQALLHPRLRNAFVTQFTKDFSCDQVFPSKFLTGVSFTEIMQKPECSILKYDFNNVGELMYLGLLKELIAAPIRPNRTGINTRGLFMRTLRFNLRDPRGLVIPLITTKKVNFAAIYHELIWFLRASTDTKYLVENGVKIWDGNSTREFLDSRGLTQYNPGEVGPIYGYQWRKWNKSYNGTNCQRPNVDQLRQVIDRLKLNPEDRRLIVSSWNVEQLDEMALPPCFLDGTPVRVKNGYIPIEMVNLKHEMYNSTGEYEPINKIYITNYSGEIHLLNIYGFPEILKVTPNHPMLCKVGATNVWKKIKNITTDDEIAVKINRKSIIPSFDQLLEYENTKLLFLLDNVDIWYMLGYFVGKGRNEQLNNSIYRTSFFFDQRGIKQSFPIINRVVPIVEMDVDITNENRRIEIRDRFWWSIFNEFGHPVWTLPEWVHDAPAEFIIEFLRGYWDSGVRTTTSISLALGLQALLLKVGIPAVVSKHHAPNQFDSYMVYHHDAIKMNADYAYYKVITNLTTRMNNINVYNFDVGNDHTYTVGNLITHNCHFAYQFHVDFIDNIPKYLNCAVFMRSADVALGVPFNVASYALLTNFVAYIVGLTPGELVINMTDCHIYESHINGIKIQLSRTPRRFPIIQFGTKITSYPRDKLSIDTFANEFSLEDYNLLYYEPYNYIKLPMVV